jgi:uncharacterized circularly permuted ATP-grasp superfamily protein/uncharacterized alpha-E superfamily protein
MNRVAVSETDKLAPQKARAQQSLSVARYDEMLDHAGALRPHWQAVARTFKDMRPDEYARRLASTSAMMRDNGVTYNVYDEAGGRARPWQLDIVPFVIGASDWKVIEAGIAQRARLADLILRDIYGPQTLIAEGHIPPHIVLGHPQFLRPLISTTPPGGVHVHLYSADLARKPDGSWVVLSARADAPSGIGYALENRIVISQTFPDLFRDLQVERLASFFHSYREHVLGLAEQMKGRAAILTPGPFNEAYFEHAYLAHYLGLTLVEGQDLVVRDGAVYLKTLAGLERVAVVFRRLDSDFCDPLEFRAESKLGVPGLAEAARTGGVVLANALGGGVVESPGINAYLPNAASALIDEELAIPDIATIWCGTAWGRNEAMARLRDVVVRDTFDARQLFWRGSSARLGSEMNPAEVADLATRMERRGATFVVQDIAPLGLAPVYGNDGLTVKPASIRVFAAWTPEGYRVMPGALTRVAQDETVRALSMQSGAASKDTWVLSATPVDDFTLLQRTDVPLPIRRVGDVAPSRAMDNLFWLGRYAERAENLVRILRTLVQRLGDDTATTKSTTASELARWLLLPQGQVSVTAIADAATGNAAKLAAELRALVISAELPHGPQRLLQDVQRTAWAVRDRLSFDTWRAINALTIEDNARDLEGRFDSASMRIYFDALIRRAAALSGLAAENMTRGSNWLFFDVGRRIERAAHVSWLVRQMLASQGDEIEHIQHVLEIADSAMTYRSRYLNVFQVAPTIDLLLLDSTNPRSVAFQIAAILRHVLSLPKITFVQRKNFAKIIIDEARNAIVGADPAELARCDETGKRVALDALSGAVEDIMPRLSDAIADAYFQHAPVQRAGYARREWNG